MARRRDIGMQKITVARFSAPKVVIRLVPIVLIVAGAALVLWHHFLNDGDVRVLRGARAYTTAPLLGACAVALAVLVLRTLAALFSPGSKAIHLENGRLHFPSFGMTRVTASSIVAVEYECRDRFLSTQEDVFIRLSDGSRRAMPLGLMAGRPSEIYARLQGALGLS